MRRARGLTLIELLVAVAIFAILSGFAYRALTAVLDARTRIEQENRKWRDVGMFFARLEQDIAAVTPRPVRDSGDRVMPALVGNALPARANEGALMLTRMALSVGRESVDPPRRVGYRLRNGVVELLIWDALDQGTRDEPRVVSVLSDVRDLQLAYLDRRGQRYTAWPVTNAAPESLPNAVEVGVTLASGERITRLFPTSIRLSAQSQVPQPPQTPAPQPPAAQPPGAQAPAPPPQPPAPQAPTQ